MIKTKYVIDKAGKVLIYSLYYAKTCHVQLVDSPLF